MKKTLFFPLTALVLGFVFSTCQYKEVLAPADTFVARYDPFLGATTQVRDMVCTSDGGFAVTGRVKTDANENLFIAKFDSTGKQIWAFSNYLPQQNKSAGNAIIQTANGDLAVCGFEETMNGYEGVLFKVDNIGIEGPILRKKSTAGYFVQFYDLIASDDNRIVVVGDFSEAGIINSSALIGVTPRVIINAGDEITTKTFKVGENLKGDGARAVCTTNDGGYFVAGDVDVVSTSDYSGKDLFVCKFDKDLNILGKSEEIASLSDKLFTKSIINDGTGGCVVAFQDKSGGKKISGLVQVNPNLDLGNTAFVEEANTNLLNKVCRGVGGVGFAACGTQSTSGFEQAFLHLYGQNLGLIHQRKFSLNTKIEGISCDVWRSNDKSGYGIGGWYFGTNQQILLIKTDATGNVQ